jgi:hypothetical protein
MSTVKKTPSRSILAMTRDESALLYRESEISSIDIYQLVDIEEIKDGIILELVNERFEIVPVGIIEQISETPGLISRLLQRLAGLHQ